MVLFKRKAVRFLGPPAAPVGDATDSSSSDTQSPAPPDVWYIKQTGEYFFDYDEYLRRMDFYNQRRFICEITGHSNLSFFEALESETAEAREVDEVFPDALKDPVLRRLQFSTTSRLDHLVDEVYEAFSTDFYPGEYAFATINNDKVEVLIREKTQFNAIRLPNGEVTPAYAKYRVEMVGHGREGMEDIVDGTQLTRDRKRFSKSMLRTFMKNTISREPWSGAPWLVKPKYAQKYRIPTAVPPHLIKNGGYSEADVAVQQARKLKKRIAVQNDRSRIVNIKEDPVRKEREPVKKEVSKRPPSNEDLDIIPLMDPPIMRPPLKVEHCLPQEHVGLSLETWVFLNMFCQTLQIGSVNYDEFLLSLRYGKPGSGEAYDLFVSIHCALLKLMIGTSSADYLIALPATRETHLPDADDEMEDDEASSADSKSRSPGVDNQEAKRTNRLKEITRWRSGGWKERLQRRLFANGGLEVIILGLLNDVEYVPDWHELCEKVINFCAPLNMSATMETARTRYAALDIAMKLRVLSILIRLVGDSIVLRERIEFCMEESTRIRRERLETHKEHKSYIEQVRVLEEERSEMRSQAKEEAAAAAAAASEDKEVGKAKLRNRMSREKVEAKAKCDAQEKRIALGIETAQKGIQKCLAALKQAEVELRVLDCQRIRPIGTDRFFNRYWWFENNGLPLITASSGKESYHMGRLWVQGPSEEDHEVFIKEGKSVYGELSFTERKNLEVDADCRLDGLNEWGFYDDTAEIDELHAWLSNKGVREPRLRKDLDIRHDRLHGPIMLRRKQLDLDNPEQPQVQPPEEEVSAVPEQAPSPVASASPAPPAGPVAHVMTLRGKH
ncbi:ATP-utilizing chromatin assembly and remodelling N-terminal-domain-containing protein [Limtongia smithiae]|uniref:ATP-utilizing chromatin assembly and remodelling N-terminal-domain-containing protein n=1 Tax=Limtongia smithiae TaxID=1125753 RepID=UPI0034CD12D8